MTWTRIQVATEHLDVTVSTLRGWERASGFKPVGASAFGDFTPATYDAADIAVLQVIRHASQIGLGGAALAQVYRSANTLRPHFLPGWSGLCVTSIAGRAWVSGPSVPGQVTVNDIAAALPSEDRIQVVAAVVVPQ